MIDRLCCCAYQMELYTVQVLLLLLLLLLKTEFGFSQIKHVSYFPSFSMIQLSFVSILFDTMLYPSQSTAACAACCTCASCCLCFQQLRKSMAFTSARKPMLSIGKLLHLWLLWCDGLHCQANRPVCLCTNTWRVCASAWSSQFNLCIAVMPTGFCRLC